MRKVNDVFILICVCFSIPFATGSSNIPSYNESGSTEVTVYNDQGFIKENRNIILHEGEGEFQINNIASQINPSSVHLRSLDSQEDFSILEQRFEYDLLSPAKLLQKYVGKTIKIVDWNQFKDRKEIVDATLLSLNEGEVYRINGEIYLGHPGTKVLPQLPESLFTCPTLVWTYSSKKQKQHAVEISYLTKGMSWHAEYSLVLTKNDKYGDLDSWITVDNSSGASFKNAALKFVAGQLNTVSQQPPQTPFFSSKRQAFNEEAFNESSFSEYHLYSLQRKTDLDNNQMKQISFFNAGGLLLKKEYVLKGWTNYFANRYNGNGLNIPVQVYYNFLNSKENKLGRALPAGIVRIYSADQKDAIQFLGEDNIVQTPENETVKLNSGNAFDIVAVQTQTNFKQITTQVYESEWKVEIRNHKNLDIEVAVLQQMPGNWEILSSNYDYKKTDAFTARFEVPVQKQKSSVLVYKVRTGLQ